MNMFKNVMLKNVSTFVGVSLMLGSAAQAAPLMVDFDRRTTLDGQADFTILSFDDSAPTDLGAGDSHVFSGVSSDFGSLDIIFTPLAGNTLRARNYATDSESDSPENLGGAGGIIEDELSLFRDWMGSNGTTLTMTLSGLAPGQYEITSIHARTQFAWTGSGETFVQREYDVALTDSLVTGFNVGTSSWNLVPNPLDTGAGDSQAAYIATQRAQLTYNFTVTGTDDVVITVTGTEAMVNGFVLDVVPEPSSMSLVLAGLGCIGMRRRLQRQA